jgi:hypothetical protein
MRGHAQVSISEAPPQPVNPAAVLARLREWGRALGFSQIGVADIDLQAAEAGLLAWLAAGFHGDMHYMQAHGLKRARPAELVPGTVRVITARLDYLPRGTPEGWQAIEFQRLATPAAAAPGTSTSTASAATSANGRTRASVRSSPARASSSSNGPAMPARRCPCPTCAWNSNRWPATNGP